MELRLICPYGTFPVVAPPYNRNPCRSRGHPPGGAEPKAPSLTGGRMTDTANRTFHDGRNAPLIGLGTWQIPDESVDKVVAQAIEVGYRSIDTAAIYDNEAGVGKGIRESGIPRSDLFVTTKLWNDAHAHGLSRPAFEASLEHLGLDYVDLYLIHWPAPQAGLFVQAWESLIQLRDEGLAKSIGVCNFDSVRLQ